jgi:hypothetical protein
MKKTDEPQTTAIAPTMTPMAMIEQAIQGKADVAILERLMTLQERWEANEAKKEYDAAFARARELIKPIVKTQDVNLGGGKGYKYETLSNIADDVDGVLANEKLSYRYTSSQNGDLITVTCIVSHERGHREEATLSGKPDTSGSKNPIQAIGSAVTYLQRYTLKLALGLSAARDDDARAAGTTGISAKPEKLITAEQYQALMAMIEATGQDERALLNYLHADDLNTITEAQYKLAFDGLKRKLQRIQERIEDAKAHKATMPRDSVEADEAPDAPAQP